MGGGQKVQKTDPAQAAAANAGATGSANNATALSNLYSGQQQQLFNSLYGSPGAGGTGGAVSGMLDPSKLNVTSPTGVYGLQNTRANEAAAKQYASNASNIKSNAAQSGFGPGTPAGFTESELNRNANALADTKGSNFATSTTNQYQDALSNFWKAAGMTQQASGTAGAGALGGNQQAGNVYGNLYGTAGHGNVVQSSNWLSPILGAAGTIGGAALGPGGALAGGSAGAGMCVAAGTTIRLSPEVIAKVEDLCPGDSILGIGGPLRIVAPLEFAEVPCLRLLTDAHLELLCSPTHTLLRPGGGYVRAKDALGEEVLTWEGKTRVIGVEPQGPMRVVHLQLDGSHTFCSGGLWSEE